MGIKKNKNKKQRAYILCQKTKSRGLQNYYKGHMDKIGGDGGGRGGRWFQPGWGEVRGEKAYN